LGSLTLQQLRGLRATALADMQASLAQVQASAALLASLQQGAAAPAENAVMALYSNWVRVWDGRGGVAGASGFASKGDEVWRELDRRRGAQATLLQGAAAVAEALQGAVKAERNRRGAWAPPASLPRATRALHTTALQGNSTSSSSSSSNFSSFPWPSPAFQALWQAEAAARGVAASSGGCEGEEDAPEGGGEEGRELAKVHAKCLTATAKWLARTELTGQASQEVRKPFFDFISFIFCLSV